MDKTNQSIEQIFTDPKNLDNFLENPKELEYILYELLTQGDNIRFIQILTLLKRRLNQITRTSEDNNEKVYKIGYAEGMLNLCMKISTFKSEIEMKEMNSSENLVENIENNCWHSTLKHKKNYKIKTDEDYNIYILATTNDIDVLIKMKNGLLPNPHGYSKTELSRAIELYNTEEFVNTREELLKDNIEASYEVTLIIDDFGKEFYSIYDEPEIDEYLKGFSNERFRIKDIKHLKALKRYKNY